jgi:probable rRNA maturation factor
MLLNSVLTVRFELSSSRLHLLKKLLQRQQDIKDGHYKLAEPLMTPSIDVYFENCESEQPGDGPLSSPQSILAQPQTWWSNVFQAWITLMAPTLPQEWQTDAYDVSLRLTDDDDIQALNRTYRQIDRPTDVLSFASLEVEVPCRICMGEPLGLGDIIISVPTATRHSVALGHSLELEIVWLAAHGFLHLLGWDHPDDESLSRMVQKQGLLLEAIALIPPKAYENFQSIS